MTVLFLIDSLTMGGAERTTLALSQNLDRQRIKPMICTLLPLSESELADQTGDVPCFELGMTRLLQPSAWWRFYRLLKTQQVDLIHAQVQDSTLLAGLFCFLLRIPLIVTRHIVDEDRLNWRRRLRNQLEKEVIRFRAARIITVSEAVRDHYARLTGLPLRRFQTIYNGLDLASFELQHKKSLLRAQLNLPQAVPLIVMVGVMRPGKGHEICIAAARLVPDAHFLLVGDGDLRSMLDQQAADVRDRVHFMGQRMDIPQILNAVDILVLPSEMEALPTVLIEAAAAKLPVIATQVGGIPEIVEHEISGLLIPPRDPQALAASIQRLMADPDRAQKMGQHGYEIAQRKFSLAQQVETITQLYEAVIKARIYP